MIAFTALLLSTAVFANSPRVIPAPIDHLFIPAGFDNNDNVELVVTGFFPNTCYSRNSVNVEVKDDVVNVNVMASVRDGEKAACADLLVPFKEVISVGNLQGGEYKVVVNRATRYETTEVLKIDEAASQNRDDHLYAMVDYIELGFVGGTSGHAELVGWTVSDCLALDRVEYISNGKDTLSILPIMKKVRDFCPMKMMELTIPVQFNPASFKHSKVLLMGRTIDGKSVNALVDKN